MKFIIEHLEPELFPWCVIEYKHISKIVGKENLIITNLQKKDLLTLKEFADCRHESVKNLKLKNACILDPETEKCLSPKDKFNFLIFGGILGDYPPRKRTKDELIIPGLERRNLGKEQMPTDNAVFVAKEIAEGKEFSGLKFADNIEIPIAEGESVMMPFRYVIINGKPLISEALIKHLRETGEF